MKMSVGLCFHEDVSGFQSYHPTFNKGQTRLFPKMHPGFGAHWVFSQQTGHRRSNAVTDNINAAVKMAYRQIVTSPYPDTFLT